VSTHFEQQYEALPHPVWEEDWSAAEDLLSELRLAEGTQHIPDVLHRLRESISIRKANRNAFEFFSAADEAQLSMRIEEAFSSDAALSALAEDAVAAVEDRTSSGSRIEILVPGRGEIAMFCTRTFYRSSGSLVALVTLKDVPAGSSQDQQKGITPAKRDRSNPNPDRMNSLRQMAARLSGLGAWEIDARTLETTWSEELREILEYTPEFEPALDSIIVFYHPDDLPHVTRAVNDCLDTGRPADLEARISTRTGRLIWCRVIMEAARDSDGTIVSIQGAIQDITPLKTAELEIERGNERFRQLADAMPIIVWTALEDGTIDFANAALREYAAIQQDVDPDEAWRGIIHPEDLELVHSMWMGNARGAAQNGTELRLRRAEDGLYRWHVVRSVTVRNSAGDVTHWYGTAADVHDSKSIEQEARSLAKRLFATVESITDAFFTLDHEWRFTYLNAEAERVLERSRLELLGRNIWEEFAPARDSMFFTEYHRAADTGATVSFEELYHPLGKWFEVKAYPSADGLTVYFQDITERRRRDAQLRLLDVSIERINDIVMIIEVNDDGPQAWRIVYVNAAFEEQTGFARDEVIGHTHGSIFPLKSGDAVMERIRADMIAGEPARGEFLKVGKGGKTLWVEADIVPVRAEDTITHWVAIERNVTGRRAMDEALRTREERFRLLSNATNDAIWDWDLHTNSIWVNEGFERLFGVKAETFEPGIETWTSNIHPADRDRVTTAIMKVIKGEGSTWRNEYRFIRHDKTIAEVVDRGSVLRDSNGEPVRLFGGIVDITRRKHVERQLAEHAELLNKTQDAIIVRDLDHRILFWSHGAQRLYGWTPEEAIGQPIDQLLYNERIDFLAATNIVKDAGEWSGEIEQRDRSGRRIHVLGRWSLVNDDTGNPSSILAINSDITERKALEEQVIRAQRLESIGTLAGGMAHDLNNVFAPILLNVELLKMDETDPERASVLSAVEADAHRGAHMVHQVLTFARGEDGRREEVDTITIVDEVERVIRDTFPKSIAIKVRSDSDAWTIMADATQIYQVVMNLCVNSRDAMPDGGTLEISIENQVLDEVYARLNLNSAPGPYVVISVSDTGMGMEPDVIDRLWEPFFTTKGVGQGTGLGLPTSHTIIKRLGGFINVYSEPNKGSEFKVYLPAGATPRSADAVAVKQTRLPRGNGQLVLVIDDEEGVREVVRKTLERFGYRVMLAQHGAAAVAMYARHFDEIDVVLTDMAMPIMDGPTTIIALKQIDPEVRIIGSSGLGANGNVAKAVGAGVKHFVSKPYTVEALLKTLHAALEEQT
jgi:PAS domain S-box-containing protein